MKFNLINIYYCKKISCVGNGLFIFPLSCTYNKRAKRKNKFDSQGNY